MRLQYLFFKGHSWSCSTDRVFAVSLKPGTFVFQNVEVSKDLFRNVLVPAPPPPPTYPPPHLLSELAGPENKHFDADEGSTCMNFRKQYIPSFLFIERKIKASTNALVSCHAHFGILFRLPIYSYANSFYVTPNFIHLSLPLIIYFCDWLNYCPELHRCCNYLCS